MPKMVEVVIDSVRVSLTNQQRIVVLREVNAERYLPIWIGPYEAEAITIALQEIEVARPQTHDLMKNVFSMLNARLLRVEVVALKDDVFYGNLVVDVNDKVINIDARPSDTLALAVRAHVPIMVSKDVIDTAGIEPEKEAEEQDEVAIDDASESAVQTAPEDVDSEERLSIFEDFLQKLDIDDISHSSGQEDDKDEDKPTPQ